MKLAMSRRSSAAVAVLDGEALDLGRVPELSGPAGSITELLAQGSDRLAAVDASVQRLRDSSDAAKERMREQGILAPLAETPLMAPFPRPGLLFFTGGNYRAHLDEISRRTGMRIDPPASPIGFLKNSNTVIGPDDAIVLPPRHPDMVDFEVELSFVIGRPCHDVDEKDAAGCIAGYTIVNDVSARDWNESARRPDGTMDLTMPTFGKQFPTFCPMGPVFVTADEIDDPYGIEVALRLNGELMQSAQTGDLLFGFEKILSYFSRFFRFRPGDVITTGSPPGVGFARQPPVFLRRGDRVEISATGIGSMSNPVA